MKLQIIISEDGISFGPAIDMDSYVFIMYEEFYFDSSVWFNPDTCSEKLTKAYMKFCKRMKLNYETKL